MVATPARARYREATKGYRLAFLAVLMVTLRAIWGIAVPASRKARTCRNVSQGCPRTRDDLECPGASATQAREPAHASRRNAAHHNDTVAIPPGRPCRCRSHQGSSARMTPAVRAGRSNQVIGSFGPDRSAGPDLATGIPLAPTGDVMFATSPITRTSRMVIGRISARPIALSDE
jgi:hypothetical protein